MKIAILGVKGFLGKKLSRQLINQGVQVIGYVLGDPEIEDLGFECRDVTELLGGKSSKTDIFDVTINLAARRSTRANPITDERVIEFCYEIPKRFLTNTTSEKTLVINTSTYIQNFYGIPGNTVDSYSKSKEKLSKSLEENSRLKNLNVLDLYLFTLYGIDDRQSRLVPMLMDAAHSGEEILLSPGHQLMNLLYVEDAVQNIIRAMSDSMETSYRKHFLWNESYFSVRDLISRIETVVQKKINCTWGARPYVGHEMMEPWPVPMTQLPNFEIRTSLDEGLKAIWASRNSSTD